MKVSIRRTPKLRIGFADLSRFLHRSSVLTATESLELSKLVMSTDETCNLDLVDAELEDFIRQCESFGIEVVAFR